MKLRTPNRSLRSCAGVSAPTSPMQEGLEAFAALADRYGLRERLQAFLDAPEGTYEKVWTAERFWRELGASL